MPPCQAGRRRPGRRRGLISFPIANSVSRFAICRLIESVNLPGQSVGREAFPGFRGACHRAGHFGPDPLAQSGLLPLFVTTGLDPVVHAEVRRTPSVRSMRASDASAWIAGSSPAMTKWKSRRESSSPAERGRWRAKRAGRGARRCRLLLRQRNPQLSMPPPPRLRAVPLHRACARSPSPALRAGADKRNPSRGALTPEFCESRRCGERSRCGQCEQATRPHGLPGQARQ